MTGDSNTAQAYGPIQVVIWWKHGHQEPLYLITNLELAVEACHWYRRRMRIETFFFQNAGEPIPEDFKPCRAS